MRRREFITLVGGIAALSALPRGAAALDYPTRPVHWIVGFPPGGATDIIARLVGQWLSERLGQSFVVDNRPGAGSNIGTEAVAHAPADGYTLLLISAAQPINATLYEHLNYNFGRDIAPVASISREPNLMVVHPSVPVTTVPEFIAYAKASPGKITMASSGNGTIVHVSGEMFKMMTGVSMLHVPYRGAGPAVTDLIAGQVQVMFATMPSSIEYVRAGKLRALAAAGRPGGGAVRAGLRGDRGLRLRRAEKHADRDRRQAQPRDQCDSRRCQGEGAARRSGRHGARRIAGRLC